MGPYNDDPPEMAVFWLLGGYEHFRVLIDGAERTDYERIIRVRDGARGILFDSLTYDERCSVQIQEVVIPRSARA